MTSTISTIHQLSGQMFSLTSRILPLNLSKQTFVIIMGCKKHFARPALTVLFIWQRALESGARQRPDLAIHKFAKLINADKPIPVFGDGTTRRDYTYIDDIIVGVRAAIVYDKSRYEIINLGESRMVELNQLISLLETALSKRAKINREPMQPVDVSQTYA